MFSASWNDSKLLFLSQILESFDSLPQPDLLSPRLVRKDPQLLIRLRELALSFLTLCLQVKGFGSQLQKYVTRICLIAVTYNLKKCFPKNKLKLLTASTSSSANFRSCSSLAISFSSSDNSCSPYSESSFAIAASTSRSSDLNLKQSKISCVKSDVTDSLKWNGV